MAPIIQYFHKEGFSLERMAFIQSNKQMKVSLSEKTVIEQAQSPWKENFKKMRQFREYMFIFANFINNSAMFFVTRLILCNAKDFLNAFK